MSTWSNLVSTLKRDIEEVSRESYLCKLKEFLITWQLRPYSLAWPVSNKNIGNYFIVRYYRRQKKELFFLLKKGKDIEGAGDFFLSQWDTDILGLNVGILRSFFFAPDLLKRECVRLFLERIKDRAQDLKIRLLFLKVSKETGIHHYINNLGYLPQDEFLLFILKAKKRRRPPFLSCFSISDSSREALSCLVSLAKEIFRDSHFHRDPKISSQVASLIYAKWVESASKREERIIVIKEQDRVKGFAIFEENFMYQKIMSQRLFHLNLFGLSPCIQGKGIGKLFLNTVLYDIAKPGDLIQTGASIYNQRAISLYRNIGFKEMGRSLIYHIWL